METSTSPCKTAPGGSCKGTGHFAINKLKKKEKKSRACVKYVKKKHVRIRDALLIEICSPFRCGGVFLFVWGYLSICGSYSSANMR